MQAVEWVADNSGTPLLILQREDHVKFGFGASGRASRWVRFRYLVCPPRHLYRSRSDECITFENYSTLRVVFLTNEHKKI